MGVEVRPATPGGASVAVAGRRYRPLMTESEVCELLRLHRNTLYEARRSGALRFVRLGGVVRYRHEDVISYVDARTVGPPPQA